MADPPTDKHEDDLRPTRSFWRGRLLRASGLLLVAVLVLRAGVGWHLGRRATAAVAAARARGEPTSIDQIPLADVPTSENAWVAQMRAAALVVPGADPPRGSALVYRDAPPYGPNWTALADRSERAHGRVFAIARRARTLPRARLRAAFLPGTRFGDTPAWGEARALSNVLADGAVWSHLRGRDAEAVERLRDALHLGRSARQDPTVPSQQLAGSLETTACEAAMIVAPGLRLNAGDPEAPAARAAVHGLIADLLDESAARDGLAAAAAAERVFRIDAVRADSWATPVIRPVADAEVWRVADRWATVAAAARATSWPDALRRMGGWPVSRLAVPPPSSVAGKLEQLGVPWYSRWFADDAWSYWWTIQVQFRDLSARRVAAVSLAAQLYRADRGRWPARLDDLAPAYLPAVPADPFRADGGPLGYAVKPGGLPGIDGDRPLVWIDTGPLENDLQVEPGEPPFWDEPKYGWYTGHVNGHRNDDVRQYRDLARFRRPGTPVLDDASMISPPPPPVTTTTAPATPTATAPTATEPSSASRP